MALCLFLHARFLGLCRAVGVGMRRAAKVDINQTEIVQALRDYPGVTVQMLHAVGMGCPDILVGHKGRNFLLEIKSEWARKGAELTDMQQRWHDQWQGQRAVIRSIDDALEIVTGRS